MILIFTKTKRSLLKEIQRPFTLQHIISYLKKKSKSRIQIHAQKSMLFAFILTLNTHNS